MSTETFPSPPQFLQSRGENVRNLAVFANPFQFKALLFIETKQHIGNLKGADV